MVAAKERYKALCEAEGSNIPLFLQYWWMEAVCAGKRWDVALVTKGDEVQAAMPYLWRCRCGMRYVLQPQLTPYCGPYYRYPATATTPMRRIAFQHEAAAQLIAHFQQCRLSYFQQNFSPEITDWLPFYWAGYQQTTRYTYVLPDLSCPEALFAAFDRDRRQKRILHLLPAVHLTDDATPEEMASFHLRYWHSRGERDLLSADFLQRVCAAAVTRKQGLILSLKDEEERTVAMRFVVYDDRCAHSLLSAMNPALRMAGATETLVWLTLQRLAPLTSAYDFEGSMDRGIEYFYRSFGAQQVPYLSVECCRNPLLRMIMKMKK